MKAFSSSVAAAAIIASSDLFMVNALLEDKFESAMTDLFTAFSEDRSQIVMFEREQGVPIVNEEFESECHGARHLCSHQGKPVILQAGHHVRAKTNTPIIGMLTQPLPEEWQGLEQTKGFESYFESSHVEFLQAAGARVVHIDYRLPKRQLFKELENLNGVYIPGDTKATLKSADYTYQVSQVLGWAQDHNTDQAKHFPVMGVSYGMLSMLQSQLKDLKKFEPFLDSQIAHALEQNLNLTPKETFVYDEIKGMELETWFDNLSFYNELDVGIPLEKFSLAAPLKTFVPVATFDAGSNAHRLDEMVSMFEGTIMPFFGFAYRLDKVQFGFHAMNGEGQAQIDHSKQSISHAQHVANFLVDEARLSGNKYEYTNAETDRRVDNNDVYIVTLPNPHEYSGETELLDFYRTEMYLF